MPNTPDPGSRIRDFFNLKARALQDQYELIEKILPATDRKGSSHVAEEGRYIESLLRSFLNSVLPKELRAFSGFIVRPVTKTGKADLARKQNEESDQHSNQLDIIVYDTARYPVYECVDEFAIVPPEGVVAVFSVKKRLYLRDVPTELEALNRAVHLCRGCVGRYDTVKSDIIMRAPTTGIVSFTSEYSDKKETETNGVKTLSNELFSKIEQQYKGKNYPFDMLVNQINILDTCCIFKSRPSPANDNVATAKYISYFYDKELHNGLQFMLTGILSSYYAPTRNVISRPGYTCFESGRKHDIEYREVTVSGLRCGNDIEIRK